MAKVNLVRAGKGGGLGARPPGNFFEPRPLLWLRMHLPVSYMPLAVRKV